MSKSLQVLWKAGRQIFNRIRWWLNVSAVTTRSKPWNLWHVWRGATTYERYGVCNWGAGSGRLGKSNWAAGGSRIIIFPQSCVPHIKALQPRQPLPFASQRRIYQQNLPRRPFIVPTQRAVAFWVTDPLGSVVMILEMNSWIGSFLSVRVLLSEGDGLGMSKLGIHSSKSTTVRTMFEASS